MQVNPTLLVRGCLTAKWIFEDNPTPNAAMRSLFCLLCNASIGLAAVTPVCKRARLCILPKPSEVGYTVMWKR